MSEHGTKARYMAGCRCHPYRTAVAKYSREYREKRRKETARLVALSLSPDEMPEQPSIAARVQKLLADQETKRAVEGWTRRLCAAYRDGVAMVDLISRFGVTDRQIFRILRCAGVPRRGQEMRE